MLKHVVAAIVLSSLFVKPAIGQSNFVPTTATVAQKIAANREAIRQASSVDPHQRLEQLAVANAVAERHAQLQRDTEKLIALTAELKQHVDKAGTNFLSMDVIKKAAEIQKLAKSVEEKMKNAY